MGRSQAAKRLGHIDWWIVGTCLAISALGLVVLYSAGYNPELQSSPAVKRQLVSLGIGALGFTFCAILHPTFWRRWAYLIYGAGCALLLLILFKGVVAGGARRWLDLGGIRMQPSELMKLGVILALAKVFSSDRAPTMGYGFFALFIPGLVLLIPAVLTVAEPDLGTGLCHILIGGSMLLLAGVKPKILVRLLALVLIMLPVAWQFGLKEYQQQRVLTFMSPEKDPLGSGYHAMQSKIAVGSGALTGKGFLQGTQTQLRFLPEQTTDFIFSVLAEEWGFFGSSALLCLYAILILRLITIASVQQDRFTAFVSFGVAALLFWHVVINIGMVIGVLPVVGLTLALFSYGGSSLITVLISLGIVVGSNARRHSFS
ncbi:UNVERIFIED_CONTAM: hypothetical protein GTU68_063278 [Idotea baltica]|nr:hypothetical protein [Idotea baltica]